MGRGAPLTQLQRIPQDRGEGAGAHPPTPGGGEVTFSLLREVPTRPSAPEEGCGQLPSPPPGSPTLKIEPKLLGRGKAVAKKTPN